MKPGAKVYRQRGRLIRARSGKWLLSFVIEGAPRTGYTQLRGERDDLIDHAQSIGITDLYLPGIVGLVPIEKCKELALAI